jgi:hypothetical protein
MAPTFQVEVWRCIRGVQGILPSLLVFLRRCLLGLVGRLIVRCTQCSLVACRQTCTSEVLAEHRIIPVQMAPCLIPLVRTLVME